MNKLKSILRTIWSSDGVRRVFHTAWQAAFGVLVTGLLAAHSSADVKATLFLAATTAAAAVKAALLAKKA